MQEFNSNLQETGRKITGSTTFKLFIIGVLSLTLLIPLSYIDHLIWERKNRKEDMIEKVNRDWGENVNIEGPILKIPFKTYQEVYVYDKKNNQNIKQKKFKEYQYLYVFPDELKIDVDLNAIPKRRGIYKTSVYKTQTKISGNFKQPVFENYDINANDVDWDKVSIIFKTTNNKGIEDRMYITTGEERFDFFLKENQLKERKNSHYSTAFSEFETQKLPAGIFDKTGEMDFKMNYNVRGSRRFTIVPVGNTTEVSMQSNWKDPNFTGEFLPGNEDKILPNNQGFKAEWKIIDYQRPFKKAYVNSVPKFDDYTFGVNLLVTVDDYFKAERSAKYGYLIIFLTFLVFFIIQNTGKIPMHAFHYFLIGLALVVFYTLLVSISEHINFNTSYLISATATVLLISSYSKAILKSKKFTSYILGILSLLYLYIYVIIQLENYALLVGSIGLFIILAFVMYSSRKIKW